VRSPHPLHSWHLIDASPDAASHHCAGDEALARTHATLAYGERCFELTNTVEPNGDCLLSLSEVGRLSAAGSGRAILALAPDGYRAEERIATCRRSMDEVALSEVDDDALCALGRTLLDDAARDLDRKDAPA
jgi:hypothetical protein